MLMHFYVHCWQRNPKSIYPSVSLNEQSQIFTGVKKSTNSPGICHFDQKNGLVFDVD